MKVWSASTGLLIRSLRGHGGDITDLAISYDNTILASGNIGEYFSQLFVASNDNIIRIWNFHEFKQIAVLTGHLESILLGFSPSPKNEFLLSTDVR